jgi:hypothetical protein
VGVNNFLFLAIENQFNKERQALIAESDLLDKIANYLPDEVMAITALAPARKALGEKFLELNRVYHEAKKQVLKGKTDV